MQSLRIGHYTDAQNGTGLTVFLFDQGVKGAYLLCGCSPATREVHALELSGSSVAMDALVFTGGSAFGLGASNGVMQYLLEQGRGKPMPKSHPVPIVPTAAIYDLAVKKSHWPNSDNAYEACMSATPDNFEVGRIGAGTGASVGKLVPEAHRMSGGIGRAQLNAKGVSVLAYAVVNAVGDVYEGEKIIAGATLANKQFANCETFFLNGHNETSIDESNTVLIGVFTNAQLTQIQLQRLCKMGITGIARAVRPVFTQYDGDIIFCASLGEVLASELTVGVMAAEAVRQAIINAVKESKIL